MRNDEAREQEGSEVVVVGGSIDESITSSHGVEITGEMPSEVRRIAVAWLADEQGGQVLRSRRGPPEQAWQPRSIPRSRIGWSLVFAALANVAIGLAAMTTGSSTVGLMTSGAVAVCSVLLVTAETFGRHKASGR